jgi:hypothetical protein
VTEREAAFRERLVTASVDFLAAVAKTRDAVKRAREAIDAALAVGGKQTTPENGPGATAASTAARTVKGDGGQGHQSSAGNVDDALATVEEAVSALWAAVPLLLVLFPTAEVSDAARGLTAALDGARSRLAGDWRRGSISDFGSEYRRIDDLHLRYAEAVRRDIRRGAYRYWMLRRRSLKRRSAVLPSPIPQFRYRLFGPRRALRYELRR